MSLLLVILTLFVIGFVQDVIGAYYFRLVTESRLIFAAFVSFFHSIIGWGVWSWFMYQFQHHETLDGIQIVVYSIGGAIGTYLGLRKPKSTV